MQRLVSDLLLFSRIGSEGRRLEPVDSAQVLNEVLDSLEVTIQEAGAQVEHGPLPHVSADPGQLAQVLQNLVGNAIKFRAQLAPVVRVTATREAASIWRFAVSDNGIGLDMKYAERVFKMFQRLHERDRYDGSGIGLAISKRIIERHHGTMWLESEAGQGTTVYFTLRGADSPPVAEPPATEPAGAS